MDLQPFNFQGHEVRVVMIDGEPRFVLADLCRVLDITNPRMVAQRLTPESVSTADVLDARGISHPTNVVDEGGMYEVVLLSRKPEAQEFRRWLTSEVLPQIRRTGSYGVPQLTGPQLMARALIEANSTLQAQAAQIETQHARLRLVEPKAAAFDRWLSTNCDYAVDQVAKALAIAGVKGMGRNRLFTWMAQHRWIFRIRSQWHPYQAQIETQRLGQRLGSYEDTRTGEQVSTSTIRITPKGATRLATEMGVLPETVAEALRGDDSAAA
jgi:prophage antirepressor-like protein